MLGERLATRICAGLRPVAEHVENPHVPGEVDRLETRSCAAGRVRTYVGRTASVPSGLLMLVEIVQPGAGLPAYLEIGQPASSVVRALGAPDVESGSSLEYALSVEGAETFSVTLEDERVVSVRWDWPVD